MAGDIVRNTLLGLLKPGDHIASSRNGDLYEHHGIYMGESNGVHMVTHFKAPIKDSRISCVQPAAECPVCQFTPPQDGGQVSSCIDCFGHGESIYIIKYKVPLQKLDPDQEEPKIGKIIRGYRNNKLYRELYSGVELYGYVAIPSEDISNEEVDTHFLLSSFRSCRLPEQVLEAAQSNHYMGKYSFCFNNCEDFAVYCMTGKERSVQAEKKLHKVPYKLGKKLHLCTDRHKLKAKLKEKILNKK